MKSATMVALVAGLLSSSTDALVMQERNTASSKVVGMDLQRRTVPDPVQRDRLRRRGSVAATLDNEVG